MIVLTMVSLMMEIVAYFEHLVGEGTAEGGLSSARGAVDQTQP